MADARMHTDKRVLVLDATATYFRSAFAFSATVRKPAERVEPRASAVLPSAGVVRTNIDVTHCAIVYACEL